MLRARCSIPCRRIFYISQWYEFSHMLGQSRSFVDVAMSGLLPKAVVQQTTNDGRALRKTIASATTELMRRSKCSGRAVMIYSQREACSVDSGAHEVKDRLLSCSIIPR